MGVMPFYLSMCSIQFAGHLRRLQLHSNSKTIFNSLEQMMDVDSNPNIWNEFKK